MRGGIFKWYLRDGHWSRAALLAAASLLVVSPLLYPTLGFATFLIFLQLPVYLLHQYEEHGPGAFKAFANRTLLAGGPSLTDAKIFRVNALGVWCVDCCALYLAHANGAAFGLVAPYLAVVNGLIHVATAARCDAITPAFGLPLRFSCPSVPPLSWRSSAMAARRWARRSSASV